MAIRADQSWGSNYYKHPPITDEMVEIAERQLGVKLPTEYIALLRIQNGGYTKGFRFPMRQRTSWAEDHVPLGDLAGIVTDSEHRTVLNILETAYMTQEWSLPPRQVLLSGEGHWWITLDCRNGDVPSVAWIDVERGEDFQVATSFAAFFDGLLPDLAVK
jgi:hypothetical protein